MTTSLRIALALATAIAVVAAPTLLSDLNVRLTNLALIAAIAALGLTFAFGYAGLIQLGQATFVGIGAYTSAIMTTKVGWSPWLVLPISVAIGGIGAALVGASMLRLKGHYLALATVGLNVSFEIVAKSWVSLTGGFDGISGIPALSIAGVSIGDDRRIYWLIVFFLLIVSLMTWLVRHSHFGRNLIAVRDDEIAAAAAGVDVWGAKVGAMALAGICGGLAGFLYAHYANYISPSDFALVRSIEYLAIIIVGGEASIVGAIIGALFFTYLPEWLRYFGKETYPTFFGLITLAVLILLPNGIAGLFHRWRAR